MWVESQAGKASEASWGEGGVRGVEEALEVSLGELDSAGPIRAAAGQQSGMGGTPLPLERGQSQAWSRTKHTIMQICQLRGSGAPIGSERPGLGQLLRGRTDSPGSRAPKARPPLLQGHPAPRPEDKAAEGSHLPWLRGPSHPHHQAVLPSGDSMNSGVRIWAACPCGDHFFPSQGPPLRSLSYKMRMGDTHGD